MPRHKRAKGKGKPNRPVAECIRGMIRASGPPLSPQCCIYKVPSNIYHMNVAAYEPYVVSIGPFHHGKSSLKAMEKHKLCYLQSFLERLKLDLEDLVNTIEEWEEETRACYAENIELSSNDFVQMILVDGVFIIEFFLRSHFHDLQDDSDRILTFNPGFRVAIKHDLILLENQLPFFVLERIFDLAFQHLSLENFPTMLSLAFDFFSEYNTQKKQPGFEVKHLLDLLRTFQLPSNLRRQPKIDAKFEFLYSATLLHKAGVKFKVASSGWLLGIHFENNILEIPCLKLDDTTESYIRNLMAFEQCHYPYDSHIIDYAFFMDYLINTTEDVDLLVQSGVIVNLLGDAAAVATLFNNLGKNIAFGCSNFYFGGLCEDLNAFYRVPWHHWKAIFKRDYFSTPWRTTTTIAATMLLVLTLIQTICSMISLLK
ncbi:Protein of unknown function DUF247, plant [Dillenia turbinata]|uniref:Uncharacterized protein n=1 Tax=Dillenia turbinata TaxID=194707 RepID=A0AAN8V305_9MAGN